jgi:hypothetical protein
MSEMRAGPWTAVCAAIAAIAVTAAIAPAAHAQGTQAQEAGPTARTSGAAGELTITQVRQQLNLMVDSVSAANERVLEARRNATDVPDGSFTEGGVRVTYPTASEGMTEAEINRVRRAIRAAVKQLERRYGSAGVALLEGDEWQIRTSIGGTLRPSARITLGDGGIAVLTQFPFTTHDVTDAALRRANNRAAALHPAIARFAGGAPMLSDAREQYYVAHRQLVRGRSGPARRCAAGNLSACDGLVSNDPTRWYDGEQGTPQSGQLAPITRAVHGSIVGFAIELKGAAVLDSLRNGGSADAEPIALLARIVGMPRDEFLAQWYARMLAESRRHAAPSLPLSATSLAWCGLILVIVARRRPR